jgi:hypothetical protein
MFRVAHTSLQAHGPRHGSGQATGNRRPPNNSPNCRVREADSMERIYKANKNESQQFQQNTENQLTLSKKRLKLVPEAVEDALQRRRHLILSLRCFVGCVKALAVCVGVTVGRRVGVRLAWRRHRASNALLIMVFRPGVVLRVVYLRAVEARARISVVTRVIVVPKIVGVDGRKRSSRTG